MLAHGMIELNCQSSHAQGVRKQRNACPDMKRNCVKSSTFVYTEWDGGRYRTTAESEIEDQVESHRNTRGVHEDCNNM